MKTGVMAGAMALGITFAGGAETYGNALNAGANITAGAAAQLESSVAAHPNDLFARASLLGYYTAKSAQDPRMREARLQQIEWLIENAPTCPVLHEKAAQLQPSDFAAPSKSSMEAFRTAWQREIDREPDDALVTENAYRSTEVVDARENGGRESIPYLKRLRELEPGDPQWAADLATIYGFAILRGEAPAGAVASREFENAAIGELEQSHDAFVVGFVGLSLYSASATSSVMDPKRGKFENLGQSLVRKAAELNPKNPAWSRVLKVPMPASGGGLIITETVQESDLWPGGTVHEIAAPSAVRVRADKLRAVPQSVMIGGRKALEGHVVPQMAVGKVCSVTFDALIGPDGKVKRVEVAGFSHLNIPFAASERDWLRELSYEPTLVNGKAVDVITQFEKKCPQSGTANAGQ